MAAGSPLGVGLAAALRHRRLAISLWLSLLLTSLLAWPAITSVTEVVDASPFREPLVRGWDSFGMLAWIGVKRDEIAGALGLLPLLVVLSLLLQLALTGGLLRVLIADVSRPVLRRLVSESAALFRPSLWAFARYLVTLAFWEGLLVGAPVALLSKLAGEDSPPNGPLATFAVRWGVAVGILVFFAVGVRFDLARVALARGDAPTARGAYRVAKLRLSGSRSRAVGLAVFWILVALVVQAAFASAGLRMNPQTKGSLASLFLFRQLGFVLLAAVRVAYWGSFLAFEERRRPRPFVPLAHPAVQATLPLRPPVSGSSFREPEARPKPEPAPEPRNLDGSEEPSAT